MRSVLLAGSVAIALAGCATGYQAKSFSGGFSEVRLNETTYKINVAGNGYTSADRASNIALLRAADLTTQAGYERFSVVSGGTAQNVAGATPVTTNLIGNTLFTTGGDPIVKPNGDLIITMLHKNDPGFATALDAKLIVGQLRPQLSPQG